MKQNFIIYFISLFVLFSIPGIGYASVLYLAPSTQTIYQGDSFLVEVRVDTEGEKINTVEASLNFPSNMLEVADISSGNSILNFWLKNPVENNFLGEISFIGGATNGFQGDGLLATIAFKSKKKTGSATISFTERFSRVLLNDGVGSADLLNFKKAAYNITEKPKGLPLIVSKTHPNQDVWYQNDVLHLHWSLNDQAEYSYLLSYDPLQGADEISDQPEGDLIWMGDMEYKGLDDGIYYFTLKEKLPDEDWSPAARLRAMIDTIPPEDFQPQIVEIENKNYLVFAAVDETSGIDHYEVQKQQSVLFGTMRTGGWEKTSSPYLLTNQVARGIIAVKAIDKAGNEKIATITLPFKLIWQDLLFLVALAVVGVLIWILRRRRNQNNNEK